MSKAESALQLAEAEFIKAKAGKDRAAYEKAKQRLHKARAAYRSNRDELGTVAPATLNAKAGVKGLG